MASSGFCGARAFPTFLSCSSPCLPSVWTGRHGRKHGPPSWSRGPRTWRHISPSDIPTWAPLHLRLRIHGAGLVWKPCRALLLLWHHRQTCLLLLLPHWHQTRQSNKHKKKKITNKTKKQTGPRRDRGSWHQDVDPEHLYLGVRWREDVPVLHSARRHRRPFPQGAGYFESASRMGIPAAVQRQERRGHMLVLPTSF